MNKMINEVREDPRNDLFCLMHWQTGSRHRHYLKMGMSKGIVPFSNTHPFRGVYFQKRCLILDYILVAIQLINSHNPCQMAIGKTIFSFPH